MGDIVCSLEIRIAARDDAPTLARLRFQFRSELGALVETEEEFVERCTRWMEDRLATDFPWRCWVAEGPDGIVGNLWLQVREKLPNPVEEPELHAYITNMYVLLEVRNAGVGALLLEAALEGCRSSSIDAVFLWPSDRSRSFYRRYGFSVRDDLFALRPLSS